MAEAIFFQHDPRIYHGTNPVAFTMHPFELHCCKLAVGSFQTKFQLAGNSHIFMRDTRIDNQCDNFGMHDPEKTQSGSYPAGYKYLSNSSLRDSDATCSAFTISPSFRIS